MDTIKEGQVWGEKQPRFATAQGRAGKIMLVHSDGRSVDLKLFGTILRPKQKWITLSMNTLMSKWKREL